MTPQPAVGKGYSFSAASKILEIPPHRLRYWAQIGFVTPSLRIGGKQAFSFKDLVNLRTAKELNARGFSPKQIQKALDKVRTLLPTLTAADQNDAELRVSWDGASLLVTDGETTYDSSGQAVFDFTLKDIAERATAISQIKVSAKKAVVKASKATGTKPRKTTASKKTGRDWLAEGLQARNTGEKRSAVAACFQKAIDLDPSLAAAHTNLGHSCVRGQRLDGGPHAFRAGSTKGSRATRSPLQLRDGSVSPTRIRVGGR